MRDKAQRVAFEISLVGILVLATLALAYFGISAYLSDKNYSRSDILYFSLQLFTLQMNMIEPGRAPGLMLEFARFFAPLLSSYAAARALMEIFAEPLHGLRVSRLNGHVVVCGLSQKGFDLARDLSSRDEDVVMVEWNKENDRIETCRELGIEVVLGDATEETVLRKSGLPNARLVFAVCEEDGVNAEIGLLAQRLALRRPHHAPLAIYVHVENLKLADLLRRSGLSERKKAGARIRVFNIYEFAARHALKKYPLDGSGIARDDPRRPHLVIIGFGRMGETLLLHALQSGHYANGRKMRITALDRNMKQRSEAFESRYPACKKIADLEFWNEDFEGAHVCTALERFAADENEMLSVAVCLAEDGQCLAAGLRLAEIFKGRTVPILVRLDRDKGLAELARGQTSGHDEVEGVETRIVRRTSKTPIKPFVAGGSYTSEKEIVEKDRNKLAKALYDDRRAHDGEAALPIWDELDDERRDFCRQAADHVEIKLRAVGCSAIPRKQEPGTPEAQLTPGELELLADMEHRRWVASHLLAGYKRGGTPDGRRDPVQKLHPHLVAWHELSEAQRADARALVARIPFWLAAIGKRIVRSADLAA